LTLWALAAGALAGLAAWLAWESVSGYFAPQSEIVNILGQDQSIITPEGQIRAGVRGGSVATAILGAALGLSLGFLGGWVRRTARAGLRAGLAGIVLGALGGWGVSRVLLPVFYENESPLSGGLILSLLTQGSAWTVVGAAGGLALGLGLGSRGHALRAALGGLLGAALGAAAFQAIGAMAFPYDDTDHPISKTWVTRLIVRLLVAVFASAGAALAVQTGPRTSRPPEGDR
jgi:hypothetical protein